MRTRWRTILLAGGCAAALAGCGGSSRSGSRSSSTIAKTTTRPAAPATSGSPPTTSPPASVGPGSAPGDLAVQPAARVLAESVAALRAAHGYEMAGMIRQNGRTLRLRLATTAPASLRLSFSVGAADAELIGLPSGSYIRGNQAFWRSQAGSRAARLSGRWIQVPYSNARALTSSLGSLAPATLPRCLLEDHGRLSLAGHTTVQGRSALIVRDAGNAPGSAAGEIAVAAQGPPYPLRFVATGDQRAGGRIDVCNDGRASDARGTITFSGFGHVPAIRAPADAVQPATGAAT